MSLCLVLLLVAIGINWWSGWQPFTYPFQTPWSWLKSPGSLTTLHGPEGKGVQHHSTSRHSSASALGNAARATGTGHVAFRALLAADTPVRS